MYVAVEFAFLVCILTHARACSLVGSFFYIVENALKLPVTAPENIGAIVCFLARAMHEKLPVRMFSYSDLKSDNNLRRVRTIGGFKFDMVNEGLPTIGTHLSVSQYFKRGKINLQQETSAFWTADNLRTSIAAEHPSVPRQVVARILRDFGDILAFVEAKVVGGILQSLRAVPHEMRRLLLASMRLSFSAGFYGENIYPDDYESIVAAESDMGAYYFHGTDYYNASGGHKIRRELFAALVGNFDNKYAQVWNFSRNFTGLPGVSRDLAMPVSSYQVLLAPRHDSAEFWDPKRPLVTFSAHLDMEKLEAGLQARLALDQNMLRETRETAKEFERQLIDTWNADLKRLEAELAATV